MSDNPMFLYAGEYENVDDAKADLETLKEMHREHIVGTYDAAVVTKNEEGKVKIVEKIEKPTQHGGWAGMAVGGWDRSTDRPPAGRDVALGRQRGWGDARRK